MNNQPNIEQTVKAFKEARPQPRILNQGELLAIEGGCYKIQAARKNGKITMKYMGPIEDKQGRIQG